MTPKADTLLEEMYKKKTPGVYTCTETGVLFDITQEMFDMYKRRGVPVPTVAPHVRLRRMRAHMGGIELFENKSMRNEPIISMYDPESAALLIEESQLHDDATDTMTYGRDVDPAVSFFSQWKSFSSVVPRPALVSDPNSENCRWSLYDMEFKNCYGTFGGVRCTQLLYGDMCIDTSNAVDLAFMVQTEWSYECVQGFQCSQTFFSDFCVSCRDVFFSFGCKNCSDCFACVNLEQKQYCILNVQYTKEEYEKKIAQFDLSNSDVVSRLIRESKVFWKKGVYATEMNFNSERVVGDDIIDSVDTSGVSTFGTERLYNSFDTAFVKDSCDMTTCANVEASVNSVLCTDGYANKMSIACNECMNVEYSELCFSCENCFGCIGLKRKKFCIFNTQYTEEAYWKKLDEIKVAMMQRGEYGEFFPYATSLLAYNTSHADVFFPLTRDEVQQLGGRWYTFPVIEKNLDTVPKSLHDVDESMLAETFLCQETGRPYRIVKPELEFHKKFGIALPTTHPSIRRKKRYARMHGIELKRQQCFRCQKYIVSRIHASKEINIACADCYSHILLGGEVLLT